LARCLGHFDLETAWTQFLDDLSSCNPTFSSSFHHPVLKGEQIAIIRNLFLFGGKNGRITLARA
jgi:hypothetical protein